MFLDAREYVVLSKKQETSTTSTLFLMRVDGSIPRHVPGQYITVYFPDLSPTLGKQYSISSAPCEGKFAITVKAIGRFSNRLCSLSRGERLIASGPYGDFCVTQGRITAMLAGGMGVTPFRSILVEAAVRTRSSRMMLFYSSRFLTDMPFADELYMLSRRQRSLTVEQFITGGPISPKDGVNHRRMQPEDILGSLGPGSHAEFLISGSLSFVLGQKNTLLWYGIDRADIRTEVYGQ